MSDTRLGWLSFFMMAISSRIRYRESRASWWLSCRVWAIQRFRPNASGPPIVWGRLRMLDWARFRSRVFENSLMACDSTSAHQLTLSFPPSDG